MLRTLIGLVVGVAIFLLGIPVLQSVVNQIGYYDRFTYEQAVLAWLLLIACVIAAHVVGLRGPKDRF